MKHPNSLFNMVKVYCYEIIVYNSEKIAILLIGAEILSFMQDRSTY